MGTLEQSTVDQTMELVDLISAHIYRDLTSNEIVTYLPKCQKFVGTITERMIHLFRGKSIYDLVEEGKLAKIGQRRLCPEEALSLIKQKVRLNRTILNMKLGNGSDYFKVEVATHITISDRVVFTISSKGTDDTKYEEAKRALENNPIKNLLDENILFKNPDLCSSNNRQIYYAKGDMLLSALQHKCKIVKCTKHINETKTISSSSKSSNENGCKCTLSGVINLRNSLLSNKTKTGAKSVIIQIQEYSDTVTIENRPCEELYIVKECALPSSITTEEFESEDELEKERNLNVELAKSSASELLNNRGIPTRRKRKARDLDDIREPYDSEEGEIDVPKLNSDESDGNGDESSDDPDYMKSKSFQWKSKRAAKKKQKKLVPTALRVGVPGFVLEKRRDSEEHKDPIKVKRNTNRTIDPSLLPTATALINYFEDDENLDEDFNLIFYSKDLARKLDQEPLQLLDVLKIFKEFQIVTRVMKKPQDHEKPRYEWNGIEESNLNAVIIKTYLGEKDVNGEENQGQLWKVCVDLLKNFTRSRKGEGHTIFNLTEDYSITEIKDTVQALSILESLKLVEKKTFNCVQDKQTFYVYTGTDVLGQEIEKLHSRHKIEFDLKMPKLSLIQDHVNPEKFLPYIQNYDEKLFEGIATACTTNNDEGSSNTEEKIRSLANKNRVCQCGYDKRMEVKVNRDGQNAYFKKTVRTGFKKRSRCKQCKGCLASKCGKCTPCLRPAMKKPCVDKICLFPVVPKCPCFS